MKFSLGFINNNIISENKRKALTNICWAVMGKSVSLLGVLVVGIIVARYLGQEQYGLMNYVVSYVAIFQVFADFGLDFIQIREESKTPENRDKILGTTFCIKLAFATLAIITISITLFIFESDIDTRIYILIYAISIIMNTTWVARNHFTSIVWNEYVVKTEIMRTIIGILIKISCVVLHLPLIYFIFSLVIDSLLLASGYIISYTKKIDNIRKWTFDKKIAIYILGQSFPLLLSGAAIIIYNRIDQIMIGNMIDKSHLGIYSVAVRFIELLVFVPTIISQTIAPLLVSARKKSQAHYNNIASVFMNITVWSCILLAIVTSMIASPIIYFTFGQTFMGAASVLSILAFKVIGDALSQTSGQLIIIERIQKLASIRNIIGCIVCVILNLFFIPRYGIHGAAIVSILTIIISGTFANFIIPQYRKLFYMQMKAILIGWKDIMNIKILLR